MSYLQTSPDPAIARLLEDGYDLVVGSTSLTVRDVPYVDRDRVVRRGRLTVPLDFRRGRLQPPTSHVARFLGDAPCDASGEPLSFAHSGQRSPDGSVQVCLRLRKGEYRDHHEMISSYVHHIEAPARELRPGVTARSGRARIWFRDDGPHVYGDPSLLRDGMEEQAAMLAGSDVGIVGLGGTGSYVLDLVAKTRVRTIRLIDDDVFLPHNAFRAPGAADGQEFEEPIAKVDRMAAVYSRMHRGIVPHRARLRDGALDPLDGLDFAFLCLDDADAKPGIVAKLEADGTPLVDCGIGLQPSPRGLVGVVRTTTSTPGSRAHVHEADCVPLRAGPSQDPYAFRAQVAELNALNAALAVLRWKRLAGFYAATSDEHHSVFVLDANRMLNAFDRASSRSEASDRGNG